MKKFVIIGLGEFGQSIAKGLVSGGHEVLAIDCDKAVVEKVSQEKRITCVACGDVTDKSVLESLGINNEYTAGIVAISHLGTASILGTLYLKELGVQRVLAKTESHEGRRVLEKLGANEVILPDLAMGEVIAERLSNPGIESLRLSNEFTLFNLPAPAAFLGKSVQELGLRKNYQVNIVAIESGAGMREHHVMPDHIFQENENLSLIISNNSLTTFKSKFGIIDE